MKKKFFILLCLCTLCIGSAWGDSYTITFATGSGDGTEVNTTTACSTVVSDGSDYLSGNLVTANKVYYKGGSGLKLGASSTAGTIKMNLSTTGQVTPTSIVVIAKLYNSGKATTLKVNGSATQNLAADFADYTFAITSKITYLELVTSKYAWISSITVNYAGDTPSSPSISCTDITDVPCEGVNNATTTVTFNNADGWTPSISETDGLAVTSATIDENGIITYSVSESSENFVREGWFIIQLSKEGEENVTKKVKVFQNGIDYAKLPFEYNGGISDLPKCFTQSGLGTDYGTSPKFKFDGTDDFLILKINEEPGELKFDIKGNSFSGGTFEVQTSTDGTNYENLSSYTSLSDVSTKTISNLSTDVRYIKWIYTNKSSGNVALGNIKLAKHVEVNYWIVKYDANGGTGAPSEEQVTKGNSIDISTKTQPTRDGYDFAGWTLTKDDDDVVSGLYTPESNVTLYAKWIAHKYTLTITQPEAGGTLTVKNGETQLATGANVEVGTKLTCEVTNIPKGKRFSRFYAKWGGASGQSKYKETNPATFDNIATEGISALEVYVTYKDLDIYTINYMINGVSTGAQENVYEGTELVFPNVEGIAGKVFCGWVKEAIDGTTNTKPTFVSTVNQTANETVTYYAVFANKEGEGDDKYVKVTSAPADWSGEYLLVNEGSDNNNVAWTGVDAAECNVTVTISNGEIATKPDNAVTLIIAAMDGGYSIQVNGGTNDGKYINQTTYDNKITFNETPSANTLSYSSSENSTVIAGSGVDANSGNHVTMRYNSASDQKRFRYYKSGQQSVQLYLKHGATYSDYCTDISYTRTVNTANIGTLCVPYAFEKPDYMTLYNIVGKADSKIYFEETENVVAGQPYLFRSTEKNITLTYTGEKATEAKSSNGLVGTFDGCTIIPNAYNYILSNNTLYYVDSEFNCGANRAYINIGGVSDYNPSAAKSDFTLDFNEPTGITSYENDNDNENLKAMTVYNLNGMRVNGSYKGIVVVNGKKYINK